MKFFLKALFLAGILLPQLVFSQPKELDKNLSEVELYNRKFDQVGGSFSLRMPAFTVDSDGLIKAGDLTLLRQAGAPKLPFYSTFIAVPPAAEIVVEVMPYASTRQKISELSFHPYPISPAVDEFGAKIPAIGARQQVEEGTMLVEYRKDPEIYQQDKLFPAQLYRLSEPTYFRDIKLVQLSIFPYRYNPGAGELDFTPELDVRVTFSGADLSPTSPPDKDEMDFAALLGGSVVNVEQVGAWRSLSQALHSGGTALPVGQETYRIELTEDGIYEISGQDLADAGMNISAVDPNTIQMLYRGDPVAYQFVGNADNVLESTEKIRFYGWKFNDSRLERQYFDHTVYWLWADGSASRVADQTNNNSYIQATNYRASITKEPENHFFSTWIGNWELMPNEPDAWFWDKMAVGATKQYIVDTPDPDNGGTDVLYTAEFTPQGSNFNQIGMEMSVNNDPGIGSVYWYGKKNVNLTSTVPANVLTDTTTFHTQNVSGTVNIYLNRITVEYDRQFKALDNQLIFDFNTPSRRFEISGFSADSPLVWDISDRLAPVNITLTGGDIVDNSGNFTYKFGSANAGAFIATNHSNLKTPISIDQYTPPSLDPPSSGNVDWLAISYGDFLPQANRLASHRAQANYGNHDTLVIDIYDLVQQYGYGFPIPQAYHNYLGHALSTWNTAPTYVTLFGDSTINPRQITCLSCSSGFNTHEISYVPTGMVFVDLLQGLVPSDTALVMLDGSGDLIPDFEIGRIPGQNLTEIANAVDKIILYDQNTRTPSSWQNTVVLVSDANDGKGNYFCNDNNALANELTSEHGVDVTHLCLPHNLPDPPSQADIDQMRVDLHNATQVGATIVNYRGHGAIDRWGHSTIFTSADATWWGNPNPYLALSADCLDGYFVMPGLPGLAESFLTANTVGSAGHWSSTGLGYTHEHTVLEEGFYDAVFQEGFTTVGSAILYSKIQYLSTTIPPGINHSYLIYTFNYLGDPAMVVNFPQKVYLPFVHK